MGVGPASTGAPPPPPPPMGSTTAAGLPENTANALCYLLGFITGILFLVMEPYSRNPRTRFHAFQSIFFNLGIVAYFMLSGVLIFMMPTAIWLMITALNTLLSFGVFLFWLFLMYKAYQGETFVIPVVGPLAQQQAATR
jgi:uncharacterized membrane protein